ncbi:hypothetical protein E3N88_35047 [Mikania micrantha]|uniref:GAG-pre-integrase domain-containing protein n=1 Tax=Mikania micrantha TaxID=192012 RepID=A0A5N6LZW0_9ASTR|nr:hypothetical protein E3N88_35047 [Mikania micrantha]
MKGTVTNGTLSFEDVCYVEELNHNLLSFSQICDKSFSTHFTNKECLILKPGFVVPKKWILMRTPRINNAYIINMNSDSFTKNTCLFLKASEHDCLLWHRRLVHRVCQGEAAQKTPQAKIVQFNLFNSAASSHGSLLTSQRYEHREEVVLSGCDR